MPEVTVLPVGELPPNWDSFCSHFYSTTRWLGCSAEVTGGEVGAVCVHEGDRLLAATPYWLTTGRENTSRTPSVLLANLGVTGDSFLVAGTSTAYWSELLVGSGDIDGAVDLIVRTLRELARDRGVSGCLALYTDARTAELYGRAVPGSVPVLLNVDVRTDLPSTIEEYPVLVSKKRRAWIHREWRSFQNAGYDLATCRLADCLDEFVPLAANLERKYGNAVDEQQLHRTLAVQSRVCGRSDLVFTARRDGALVAAGLAYVQGEAMTTRMFGADYERLADAGEYFGVFFYEPVRYALGHGITTIFSGIATTRAKVMRGGRPVPLLAVDLSVEPLWDAHTARELNEQRTAGFESILRENSAMPTVTWPGAGD